MPLDPGSRVGPYEIVAPLGAGGMGEVYRARDTKLNRDAAIKVLPAALRDDPQYMARFEREAQTLAALNHPNIATVYGIEQGALVMELVEGPTLADRIAQGPIPLEEALPIARQIAEGLEAAHERGVIHRDLKPANVKITPSGLVKLLDFGLAKAVEDGRTASQMTMSPTLSLSMTQAGVILGTAGYMAPEQAAGKPVDKRADIWSFGVVLFEMLTAQRLFEGETVAHTLAHVLTRDLELGAVDGGVRPLLRRCLERDPRRRMRDIGEARLALEGPLTASPPSAAVPARSASRAPWILAAALALTLAGLAAIHFREQPPERPLSRFQVPAPEKTSFGNGMAISPDGRQLAFVADSAGQSALWLRPLDSLTAHRLAGTEGALFPFWSPDGRSLGFFTPGKLKRVDAAGGPPLTLCDVPNTGVGGSWSRDGVIVFGTNASGLFRVAAGGGAAAPLTALDASRKESFHARPWFLPDGRRYFFYANSAAAESSGIYLAALGEKARKFIVAARQGALYAPPAANGETGRLLFLRDTSLFALPLDAGSGEAAGDAFPVAEDVGSQISNPFFSVSANGVLAYRSGGDGGSAQIVWSDRNGKPGNPLGPAGQYNGWALSPDGLQAAFSKRDSNAPSDIWLLDLARAVLTRFTFDPGSDSNPVWSPDGHTIVFSSTRGGGRNLYRKGAGGGAAEEVLLHDGSSKYANDWSPDGRYLVYEAFSGKTNMDLWLLPEPGGPPGARQPQPWLATPFAEIQAQFSPGPAGSPRWIAYASNESGRYEIYVREFAESGPRGGAKFQISAQGAAQPRWRRDGRELYFIGGDGSLMAVEVKTSPRFEHGVPKPLFSTRLRTPSVFGSFRYSVAPDGKRFLLSDRLNDEESPPLTVVLNWTAGIRR